MLSEFHGLAGHGGLWKDACKISRKRMKKEVDIISPWRKVEYIVPSHKDELFACRMMYIPLLLLFLISVVPSIIFSGTLGGRLVSFFAVVSFFAWIVVYCASSACVEFAKKHEGEKKSYQTFFAENEEEFEEYYRRI